MFKAADLPEIVPIFPLPGALLLPRARLPLHIFEPRYLAMLDDALKTRDRMIAMIQPAVHGQGGEDALHHIGCAGRITQFSETEDGRYMITLTGISRFRGEQELSGFQPYRRCQVRWEGFQRDLGAVEKDAEFQRESFLQLLKRFFDRRQLSTDWESLQEADDELLINSLSMMLEFQPEDKQALLEAPSLATRRETLVTLMEFALRGGTQEDLIQ
jgi:Lon protease-like protein